MQITVLKSKIHNAIVTDANVDYVGSITIDGQLMEKAGIRDEEQVHVINHRNGERIITYAITGQRGSGEICVNGPAALKVSKGDKVIIIAYATMLAEEAKAFRSVKLFPKEYNMV